MNKHAFLWAVALTMGAAITAQAQKSLPGHETMQLDEKELAYLVHLCEGCHGKDGNSQRSDVPSLAGRPAADLFAEIERFYFYERVCPDVPVDPADASKGHMSMCDITSQINKPEAQALAHHFEAQQPAQ